MCMSIVSFYSGLQLTDTYRNMTGLNTHLGNTVVSLYQSTHSFENAYMAHAAKKDEKSFEKLELGFSYMQGQFMSVLSTPYFKDLDVLLMAETGIDVRDVLSDIQAIISVAQLASPETVRVRVENDMDKIDRYLRYLRQNIYSGNRIDFVNQTLEDRRTALLVSLGLLIFFSLCLLYLNESKLRDLLNFRVRAEENTKLLESRLAAMEASADGIGIINEEGDLTYLNSGFAKIYSLSEERKERCLGEKWNSFFGDVFGHDIVSEIYDGLLKKKSWHGEVCVKRDDAETIYLNMSLTHIPGGGMVVSAQDISAQVQADKEKKQLEEQFYQAQKMEAVGRLAGGIAHDFNNILAAISGYSEFLVEDTDKDDHRYKFASNIQIATNQAKDLVDQLLAFSRRKQSEMDYVNLQEPLREMIQMVELTFSKAIEFSYEANKEAFYIEGNTTQIAQLLMNLFVNAKDAMKDNGQLGVRLEKLSTDDPLCASFSLVDELPSEKQVLDIRVDEVSDTHTRMALGVMARDYEYAVLTVSDTGKGMGRQVMEHIFEPFYTTKAVDKGTGLGLSTVLGIVACHHGAMHVDSRVSEGTEFSILLPLQKEPNKTVGGAKSPGILKEEMPKQNANIILVEDQEEVRMMMEKMLERMGHKVTACENGLIALDEIRENYEVIDLVITDQNMPKMNGLELIIQVGVDFPDLPFMLLSGYSQRKMREMIKEQPAVKTVMRKPVSRDLLEICILRIINEKMIDEDDDCKNDNEEGGNGKEMLAS